MPRIFQENLLKPVILLMQIFKYILQLLGIGVIASFLQKRGIAKISKKRYFSMN